MKRISLMAASLLVAFMAFTSCDKPTTPDPVFTSTTEGDIAVPAGGERTCYHGTIRLDYRHQH